MSRQRGILPFVSFRGWLLVILLAALAASAYSPHNPSDFILEHALTAAFIGFLIVVERRAATGGMRETECGTGDTGERVEPIAPGDPGQPGDPVRAAHPPAATAPRMARMLRMPRTRDGHARLARPVFSDLSCGLMFLFMMLHVLGAHYTYSLVPYEAWSEAAFRRLGHQGSINDLFGWERNHFDRMVHFLFGVLMLLPAVEVLEWAAKVTRRWAVIFGLMLLWAFSHLYELIEFLFAIVLSPDAAETYNGQQGDIFDAQKDMALAFGGSLISAAAIALWRPSAGRSCIRLPSPSGIGVGGQGGGSERGQ
jgi:putative membrane protein